ncbi:uncharacterized protein LOC143918401 [Arctopsyche grandis]|uniref:uncharacterized protein LOC143918401 n=1 Tax=Arctopsyche grandis TaxID=121162 RepID=UPI00406D8658
MTEEEVEKINKGDPVWFRVRTPVRTFDGRSIELKILHSAFTDRPAGVVSLVGSISIGKSELARKYCVVQKKFYKHVIYINALNSATILDSFEALAKLIEIPTEGKVDESIDNVKIKPIKRDRDLKDIIEDVYEYFKNNGKTLMIIDHAEDADVKDIVFKGSPDYEIYTLVPSRTQIWGPREREDVKLMRLNGYSEDDIVEHLNKYMNNENEDDYLLLNTVMQKSPLAIKQSLGYIEEQIKRANRKKDSVQLKIRPFLGLFVNHLKDGNEVDDMLQQIIITLCHLAMQILPISGERGKKAAPILKIMAYLSPDDIDIEDLFLIVPEEIDRLYDSVDMIRNYGILAYDRGIGNISRLTQRALQVFLKEAGEEEKVIRDSVKTLERSKTRDHVMQVWEHASNFPKIIKDCYDGCKFGERKETPIHILASHRKDVATISKIFDVYSESIKTKDTVKNTPLHYASKHGNVVVVKFLIEKGVEINCKNLWKQTPLHLASEFGKLEVVKLLVSHKADITIKDKAEDTPLGCAIKFKRTDVVEYFNSIEAQESAAEVEATK